MQSKEVDIFNRTETEQGKYDPYFYAYGAKSADDTKWVSTIDFSECQTL